MVSIGPAVVNSPDPRINYNLLPGEYLMTCPFNHSHAIRPQKWPKHVTHCFRLHCTEQNKKNEQPQFTACKYDVAHYVPNADIFDHEEECKRIQDSEEYKNWNGKNAKWDWDGLKFVFFAGIKDEEPVEGAAGPEPLAPEIEVKPPVFAEPSAISEESLKLMCEGEQWDENSGDQEPWNFEETPEKEIQKQREKGVYIPRRYALTGLTKSEKRDFYLKDQTEWQAVKKTLAEEQAKEELEKQPISQSLWNMSIASGEDTSAPPTDDEEESESETVRASDFT